MKQPTRSDWNFVTVADIADVQGGIQKQPIRRPVNNRYPFLRVGNVGRGNLHLQEIHEVELFGGELEKLRLQSGDLLVVEGNGSPDEVGRATMWRDEIKNCVYQNHLIRVRPRGDLIPRFLELLWNSESTSSQLRKIATTTSGLHTLSASKVKAIRLAIPPLDQQHSIVAALDKAQLLRIQRRNAIALLDDLVQSVFLDMFGEICSEDHGWPSGEVSDLVAHFESGKSFSTETDDHLQARYRILKVSAVTTGRFIPTESKPVPVAYNPPTSHIVRDGDLLFSRANTESLIGATALASTPPTNLILPDKIWRFVWRDESSKTPYFLRQLFRQDEFRREITRRSSGTSGSMKNISQPKVLSIGCGIPPVELRRTYDKRARVIESVQAVHRAHLAQLDTLFASLQHRAFHGELWDTAAA